MANVVNPHAYNITVRETVFECETLFEARVKELPDVCEYAESASEAYDLAIDTIETAAVMFAEHGKSFPSPATPQDDFSGRVTLRLPKSLHRTLARDAENDGVSLNQHLVTTLTHNMGFRIALGPGWAPVSRSIVAYRISGTAMTKTIKGSECKQFQLPPGATDLERLPVSA